MFTLGQGSVVVKKHKMGDPSEPSSGLKKGKGLWNSTALSTPQIPARLAFPTNVFTISLCTPPATPPPPPPTAEPDPRLSHVLMCRQCNLTIANLLFAAHLNTRA